MRGSDFLEKPYSLDRLRQSITRAIDLDLRFREDEIHRDKVVRAMETLTAEERRVLELTADGKPDKAIAARLNLSTRTIQLRRAQLDAETGRQLADRFGPPPFALAGTRIHAGHPATIDSASSGARWPRAAVA